MTEFSKPREMGSDLLPATSSIARRLLQLIFGSYFIVTLIVTSLQLAFQYRSTEERVTQEIKAMQLTFGPGIADAAWRFQSEVLRGIVIGIVQLPIVVGVKIEDESGKTISAAGTIQHSDGSVMRIAADGRESPVEQSNLLFDHIIAQQFPVTYVDEHDKPHVIGKWHVFSNQNVIFKQVEYQFFLILINSIIKTVALWFIFLYVVSRWIGRPLTELSNFVRGLKTDRLDERFLMLKSRPRNELHILGDSLNGMLSMLQESAIQNKTLVKNLQHEQKSLRDLNETLEQRVRERTRELEAAQSQLVATARQAGMAEIATNVLHNVGNVLNSVNVSASLVGSRMRQTKAQGLARAVGLINEHAADLGDFLTRDERGKLLPGYLNKLAGALAVEQQEILDELGSLTRSVDHIKDIVATQQSYAGASCLIEAVPVRELLEDALRIQTGALERLAVTVLRDFAELPPLPLDRHRLLQILVNLISNALQAMAGSGSGRLTLRAAMVGDAEGREGPPGPRLRICVQDEGVGIPAENLTRIFSHGFTTRPNGHGFGLHSCALAAREMGGSLSAYSDGPGLGAVFTLELPIKPQA